MVNVGWAAGLKYGLFLGGSDVASFVRWFCGSCCSLVYKSSDVTIKKPMICMKVATAQKYKNAKQTL